VLESIQITIERDSRGDKVPEMRCAPIERWSRRAESLRRCSMRSRRSGALKLSDFFLTSPMTPLQAYNGDAGENS